MGEIPHCFLRRDVKGRDGAQGDPKTNDYSFPATEQKHNYKAKQSYILLIHTCSGSFLLCSLFSKIMERDDFYGKKRSERQRESYK